MIKDYFGYAKNFSGLAVIDGEKQSPFDVYINSLYLNHINLSHSYGRTNSQVINILLFEKYIHKNNLRDVLILISDCGNLDLELLRRLGANNYIFVLTRKRIKSNQKNVVYQSVPSNSTEREFIHKAGTHLVKLLKGESYGPISMSFPVKIGELDSLVDAINICEDRFEAFYFQKGFRFDFLIHKKPWTKTLVIVNQSAIDVGKQPPPVYQRWKWADDFNATTLVLNDPMLYLSEKLNGGWWIGNRDIDLVQVFVNEILILAKELNVENHRIIFYGGSAGGFVALRMASYIKNCGAIVDIPQTNLMKYQHPAQIERAFDAGFGDGTYRVESPNYHKRLDVLASLSPEVEFDLVYLQNINDDHHIKAHMIPFINKVKETRVKYKAFGYDLMHPQRGGHFPLGRIETTRLMNQFILDRDIRCIPDVANASCLFKIDL